eukprot:gene3394-293_t
MEKERRINEHIMSAMVCRNVITMFDLQTELTAAEGVQSFHDLNIGNNLLNNPLCRRYFLPPSRLRDVSPISSRDFYKWLLTNEGQDILENAGTEELVTAFANSMTLVILRPKEFAKQ